MSNSSKKILMLILTVMLIFVFAGCGRPGDVPEPVDVPKPVEEPGEDGQVYEPVTITVAELMPPVGAHSETLMYFKEELYNRSDGNINVEIHWDATLLGFEEVLRGVQVGSADMTIINVTFFPTELPTWQVFNTYLTGPDDLKAQFEMKQKAINEIPNFHEEFEKQNQKIVYTLSYTPAMFGTHKQIESIKDGDLEGLSIRAASRWHLVMLREAGATPVSLSWGEVYEALDRRTIDGCYTSIDSFARASLDEVTPYYVWHGALWVPQPVMYTMNLDFWDSLSPATQDLITEVAAEAEELGQLLNEEDIQKSIDIMIERSDVVIEYLDDEEIEWWTNLKGVRELPLVWAEEVEKLGVPAKDILETIGELRKEYIK